MPSACARLMNARNAGWRLGVVSGSFRMVKGVVLFLYVRASKYTCVSLNDASPLGATTKLKNTSCVPPVLFSRLSAMSQTHIPLCGFVVTAAGLTLTVATRLGATVSVD